MSQRTIDVFVRALKIAAGTVIAILIAEHFSLQNASSAGIIALLTILPTRQRTFKLVASRIISFFITMIGVLLLKKLCPNPTAAYGILLFFVCAFVYSVKWDLTLSVNAVIGTHFFLTDAPFTVHFILNEALILIIGTSVAALINLLMSDKEHILNTEIKKIEQRMTILLHSMALHILKFSQLTIDKRNIDLLVGHIDEAMNIAFVNQENTLQSHSSYYIEYLRMRKVQCTEFLHIYREIISLSEQDLESIKEQADLIVELLNKAAKNVGMEHSSDIMLSEIKNVESILDSCPIPKTKVAFKARFTLYHLISELEENELLKRDFIEQLTVEQKKLYLKK